MKRPSWGWEDICVLISEDETAPTTVSTTTTASSNSGSSSTVATSSSSNLSSNKVGASSLRRTAGGRCSSSSGDAASSSSSSDNLVLNICQEKNLSAVADPSSADVKPAAKLKLQAVKESLDGPAAGSSLPPKKEEKMEVDDDSQDFKLKVSYTANMSSVPAPKSDPFTPTPADFAVVTAHVDLMPASTKRGRSSSSDRGGRRAKRGSRDGSGGSKRGRWSGGGRAPLAADMDQSPPSSPDSDHVITPKRGRKRAAAVAAALELKESPPSTPTLPTPPSGGLGALTTNGPAAVTSQGPAVSANTLLLGNQINPASAVAQEMTDTLHAELQAHSIYKQEEEERVTTPLVGPALPGKKQGVSIGVNNSAMNCSSNGNNSSGGSSSNGATQPPPFPQSLEQLLERQWERGSQFLMEQAQHFDIASLLSCLHQLRQENSRLEESVTALSARRDHLLAVNARLSVPLGPPSSSHVSSASPPGGDGGPSGPSGPGGQHTPQHPITSASLNSSPVGGGVLPSRSSPVAGAGHHQPHPLMHNSTTPPSAAPPPPPSGPVVSSHHLQQHHPPPQHHLASGGIAVSSHGGVMSAGHMPPSHRTSPGGAPQHPPHPQLTPRQQPQQPTRHPSGGAVGGGPHHRVVSPHDRRPVTHSPQENGGLESSGDYPGKSAGYHRPPGAGGGPVVAQPQSPSMMPPHQPPPPQHHRHSPAGSMYHSSLSPSSQAPPPPHALMHPGPPPPNSSPSMGVGGSSRLVHTSGGAPPPPPPGAGVYQMVSPPSSHHAPMSHHSSQVVRRSAADTVEKR